MLFYVEDYCYIRKDIREHVAEYDGEGELQYYGWPTEDLINKITENGQTVVTDKEGEEIETDATGDTPPSDESTGEPSEEA